jgi:hypothetical protein
VRRVRPARFNDSISLLWASGGLQKAKAHFTL